MHRTHKVIASLIDTLPCCSVGRTAQGTDFWVFFFQALSQSHKHFICVPITFFSPQASHPDAWPSSPAHLNMNHYANKKSAAESMLDVALLMANASQLKAVLDQGPNFSFYTPIITLISISLCLQVTVGVLLIFIGEKINRAQALLVFTRGVFAFFFIPSTMSLSNINQCQVHWLLTNNPLPVGL